MKIFKLTRPVEITAPTMCATTFGYPRSGTIILTPPDRVSGFDPLRLSIGPPERQIWDMSIDDVVIKRRRMSLQFAGTEIDAVEHLSPLRFFYPGTKIHLVSPPRVPYFTTALKPLSALDKYGAPEEVEIEDKWFTVKDTCYWQYPEKRAGMVAFTSIQPNPNKRLEIHVTVRFKKYGQKSRYFSFGSPDIMMKNLLISPTPGIPSWLEWPARKFWAHGDDTFWPQASDVDVAKDHIASHRIQDILGAVAMMSSVAGAYPSLKIISVCSGHLADLNALRMAKPTPLA